MHCDCPYCSWGMDSLKTQAFSQGLPLGALFFNLKKGRGVFLIQIPQLWNTPSFHPFSYHIFVLLTCSLTYQSVNCINKIMVTLNYGHLQHRLSLNLKDRQFRCSSSGLKHHMSSLPINGFPVQSRLQWSIETTSVLLFHRFSWLNSWFWWQKTPLSTLCCGSSALIWVCTTSRERVFPEELCLQLHCPNLFQINSPYRSWRKFRHCYLGESRGGREGQSLYRNI